MTEVEKKISVALLLSMLVECLNYVKNLLSAFLSLSCGAIIQSAKHNTFGKIMEKTKGTR